jgi:glycosyltransferase involved in cell wall biosynthesis
MSRLSRRRMRYVADILRQGPTEAGYAFFRARRRKRNAADEGGLLCELDRLVLAGELDATPEDLRATAEAVAAWQDAEQVALCSLQWFLPWFHNPHGGGVHTILRVADQLARVHGVESRFHVYDRSGDGARDIAAKIAAAYPSLRGAAVTSAAPGDRASSHLPACDAALATTWSSVFPLVAFRDARAKFFFVQDFEPAFHPAGTASALLEQAASFGLPGIVNTPGLADVYRGYGSPAVSFVPAVDSARYHPPAHPRPAEPVQIVFYGRPSVARNAFALGLAALRIVKHRFGDRVRIVSAGEDWHPGQFGVADVLENRGALADPDAVADLYRASHVGLALQVTPHPSYQPFELMACGVATVANRNPHTTWLLRDGENALLAEPLPSAIAAAVGHAVDDSQLRERLASAGRRQVAGTTWEEQIERVWGAMTRRGAAFTYDPETER